MSTTAPGIQVAVTWDYTLIYETVYYYSFVIRLFIWL